MASQNPRPPLLPPVFNIGPAATTTSSTPTSTAQSTSSTTSNSSTSTSSSTPTSSTATQPTTTSATSTTSTSTSTSSSSTLSSSSTSSSPSSTTTSDAATLVSSTTPSVVVQTPLSTTRTSVVATHVVTAGYTLGPSSTTAAAAAAAATTSSSSGSSHVGAAVGGVIGVLAGIALLVFLITCCMRRKRKRDDDDEWNAAAFKRQSAVLLDDPFEPTPSHNHRPQNMVERQNASPGLAVQRNHPQNFYGGYGQQSMYPPGEVVYSSSPAVQPHGQMVMGYTSYDDHNQLSKQPHAAAYDSQAQFAGDKRGSVTAFQAAQYADISRQLGGGQHPAVARRSSLDDVQLPSPFDDPVEDAQMVDTPQAASPGEPTRPETTYDLGDAYDGI